jgi:hypothetical protein
MRLFLNVSALENRNRTRAFSNSDTQRQFRTVSPRDAYSRPSPGLGNGRTSLSWQAERRRAAVRWPASGCRIFAAGRTATANRMAAGAPMLDPTATARGSAAVSDAIRCTLGRIRRGGARHWRDFDRVDPAFAQTVTAQARERLDDRDAKTRCKIDGSNRAPRSFMESNCLSAAWRCGRTPPPPAICTQPPPRLSARVDRQFSRQ